MKKVFSILISLLLITVTEFAQTSANKKPQVLIFISAKCPCIYSHQETFKACINAYKDKIDFITIFIDKNDDTEEIQDMLKNLGWKVKYVVDKQKFYTKTYHPKATTDCVFVSASGEILYKGAVDDSPLNMGQVLNFYVKDAIEDFLNHKPVKVKEGKSFGCTIVI